LFHRDERNVTTSKRRHPKSKKHGTPRLVQGDSRETRTFPFQNVENPGDVRLAALKIRRFEILDEIGRGGHGVVFRANDRVLKRLVALKLPRPEVLHSKEMRRRFVAEAQVVAALDHPNIIKVYDAGFEAAVCYIAQELCNGPSLGNWLKDQPAKIRADVAASVTLALARGLDHAHQRGVLHRDLKPANVLLKPRFGTLDEGSALVDDPTSSAIWKLFPFTPKLGDFGICKAFDGDPDQTGTRTGLVLGTAAYMAPEQAVGVASELGPQSDVYSLGAILYEMLTGAPPFDGACSADVLKRVLVDQPDPIRTERRDVPAPLEAICLKCLEKSTASRYASAAELADDLRRFLVGEPVRAPSRGFLASFFKAGSKPRRAVQIAFALAGWLLVLASLGWYLRAPKLGTGAVAGSTAGDSETAISADVRSAFNLWHENAERLRDNPNVADEMTTLLARHIPKPGDVDRRGFDWHYAWRLCHPAEAVGGLTQLASFKAHPSEVFFVAFSRDGTRFATAGQDRTARVWNANTLEPICVCSGHTNDVNWVDFAPDGRSLATASDDHSVKVWDAATGKELFTLSGHKAAVVAVRFSPMGDVLVSGDHEGVLRLWDVASRRLIKSELAAHHNKRIQSLAWGMSGQLLASIGDDNAIRLWEMPGMALRTQRETFDSMCAAFSPVANLIAYGGRGTIRIDDVHSGGCYATFSDHFDHIESIAFSPDGRQLASCDGHGALRIWDVASRQGWSAAPIRYDKVLKTPSGDPIGIGLWCVAYSPDGSRLLTAAKDGVVDVWDTSVTPQWTTVAKCEPAQSPTPLAFAPGGKRLIIAKRGAKRVNDRLQIWDVSATHPKVVRDLPGLTGYSACFSRDGSQLAVGSLGKVEICDPITCERRLTIPLTPDGVVTSLAFDGRGSLLVLENFNQHASIHVVDPSTGTKLRTITDASFATVGVHEHGFAVSPDGSLAALAPGGASLTALCDLSTGKVLPTWLGDRKGGGYVAFAPIGNVLAIATVGGVELWDPKTGKEQAFLSGLGRIVGPLAFSPDGRLLIAVSQEQKAMQVWHVQRRQPLFSLPLPADVAGRIADWQIVISPDGKQLACSVWDFEHRGGVYLYSAAGPDGTARETPSVALDETNSTERD